MQSSTNKTTLTNSDFYRLLMPGKLDGYGAHKKIPVFVEVEYKDGNLSMTGVKGPISNGDAIACGQCRDLKVVEYADGWDAEKVGRLRAVWDEWHLNDMQAGCIHQRAEKWGSERVEVVTYGLNSKAWKIKRAAEDEAMNAALEKRTAKIDAVGLFLIGPDWFKEVYTLPDSDSPLNGLYEVKKRETNWAGHVYPHQHPRGCLCKPCPVCGYKYGSAWLRQEVPADVIEWIKSLPESKTQLPGAWRR